MNITIEHFPGKFASFNIHLHAKEGAEPFITIKGCRIVSGQKGDFVSYPATKNEKSGKYWQHVYANDAFNAAVMEKARKSAPKERYEATGDDIPF